MTPHGFSREKISFELVIEPDGSSAELADIREQQRNKFYARVMPVPDRGGRQGTGFKPFFLWDNTGYVLGRDSKGKPDRSRKAFESFRDFHQQMADRIDDPELAAVAKFLASWSPERAETFKLFPEAIDKNVVFRVRGQSHFVHESPTVARDWKAPPAEDEVVVTGHSLLGGAPGPLARLHPMISGVTGAQTMGAAIASFNLDAFTSYGLEQTYNAPVTVTDAFKYTTALNRLLENRRRRIQLGDATVVFWADRPVPLEEFADTAFGDFPPPKPDAPPEDIERAKQAHRFLAQLRDGHAAGQAVNPDGKVGFYILGLSPNASRISVRFWVQSTVGEMEDRLRQLLKDMDLVGARPDDPPVVIRRIVDATGRAKLSGGKFQGYDGDVVPPLLAGAIARSVFQGTPYPPMLLGQMLNRIRADGYVSHVRVATIKACLVRNSRRDQHPYQVPPALDPTWRNPAYVTGRVFALLEKIQTDALGGDVNATIKDRYFFAASATPGQVFPTLIRIGQHHLSRMKPGKRARSERLLRQAMNKVIGFDSYVGREAQGLFAVGYFQQRQDFFVRKNPNQEGVHE